MKIGYNKQNITPTESVYIAGYSRQQPSTGVLDPIEINTIAFQFNDEIFILSLLDSIIIENSVIIPVKNRILNKYNIDEDHIIIGCIHTHSAPAFFKPFFEDVFVDPQLQNRLINQFISSIDYAIRSITNVTYNIKKVTIDGLYGNRNKMNGYSDKNIILFDFYSNKKPYFSLISMACHPTILNGTNLKLSADLFGSIRLKFKEKYHRDCMIMNGCCGDVSTRFYRKLSGEAELERVSTNILNQLEQLKIIDYQFGHTKYATVIQSYTFDARTQSFTQNAIAELEKQMISGNESENAISQMLLKNLKLKEKVSPMTLQLISHIIISGQIIFVTLPGDITSLLGKRIKEAFPDYLVINIGYCENYSNYFVCEEEYGLYFETYISRLDKGDADKFINSIIEKTKEIL